MEWDMLNEIKSPADIKKLTYDELKTLAGEIRAEILNTVAKNGGHLASNLGMVEATLALHRVFDAPEDKIIFDVGHQCYAHKLITGRYERFGTLRRYGGISGFPDRAESEYDTLNAGHSGPAISAALGIAAANKIIGRDGYTIAVVGDGSFSNGMVYEAIENCAGRRDLKLIILLNDNEMSISRSVGGMSAHLYRIRTSKHYLSFKHSLENMLNKIPRVGHKLAVAAKWVKDYIKRGLAQETVFEKLGIPYIGLVDGSDIEKLEDVLREVKSRGECCIVHMVTKKGKGCDFAEAHPEKYHSVESFDAETGDVPSCGESFSSRFGEIMCRAAAEDGTICAVTVAMCTGTGLVDFSRRYPSRFFDVGIAEEHAVAFCGGLSLSGMKPVCAMYSTFAQRSFDQLFHDVAIQRLPLTLALDRCGLVPGDGITHQGIYDVSLFSSIPGVVIYSPETYDEQEEAFARSLASSEIDIVRYPKGAEIEYNREGFIGSFDLKYKLPPSPDVVIVTYGRITANAVLAAKMLSEGSGGGYSVGVIKLVKIYPFDADEIKKLCCGAKLVYLLEEGMKSGGIAEKLAAEFACDDVAQNKVNGRSHEPRIAIRAIDGRFVSHGDVDSLYRELGFTPDAIAAEIASLMKD